MRLEFDTESGALYIGVREGRIEQTVDLAKRRFRAFMKAGGEGNVSGAESLLLLSY